MDNLNNNFKTNIYINNQESVIKTSINISIIILLNMIHPIISIIIYIGLIKYSIKGKVESLKALMISFTIYFLNPGIFKINTSIVSILRWIIFGVSIIILFNNSKKINFRKKWIFFFISWVMLTFIISILNSNLPLVSISKLFMFSLGFLSVNIGINETIKIYNWKKWIFSYCISLQYLSLFLIVLPVGYFINGSGFQGIINHPNAFGIIMTVIISIFIYLKTQDEFKCYNKLLNISIIISIIMILSSKSRTSMMGTGITITIFIIVWIKNFLREKRISLKFMVWLTFFMTTGVIIVVLNYGAIKSEFKELIFKGNSENILYSSANVIKKQEKAIKNRPILGNGFGVEWDEDQEKSLMFSLSHTIEKRNLLLALISETGIIGTLMFTLFLIQYTGILIRNKLSYRDCLFVSTIMINFGEMVFFSGNGIGIFIWVVLAIYYNQSEEILK
ncbi:Lipid A core-O-antigen ligase and related enzymes [[Clostridium] sordellii]|nr:Lipid A core-O-antigen ligase and related enzymes [[Clostridium] sordellii] [Paeniclostridium sordellii]